MSDAAVLAADPPLVSTARRRTTGRGFGAASFVISTFAWVTYQVMFVIVAVLVLLVPGLFTLMLGVADLAGQQLTLPSEGVLALFFGAVGLVGSLFVVAVVVFNGAMVTSVTSIVLGIIALSRGAKPTLPVAGILMSIPILAVNALVYLWYADVI